MLARDSVVTYGDIFKRTSCLNPIINYKHKEIPTSILTFIESISPETVTKNSIVKDDSKNFINRFMDCLNEAENANSYYEYPLMIIDKMNSIDESFANNIMANYVSNIMPYITNQEAIKETLELYNNITPSQKYVINNTASIYIAADRIVKNHESISKRFKIDEAVKELPKLQVKGVIAKICEMVDTYSIRPYQKLNLCIEESTYLFDKNAVKYNKPELVKYIVEYFLLSYPEAKSKDMEDYKLALTKSYCLTESDISEVNYLWDNSEYANQYSIMNSIESFQRSTDKSLALFAIAINTPLADENTILDITTNIGKLVSFITDYYVYSGDKIDTTEYIDVLNKWSDTFIKRIKNSIYNNVKSTDTKFDIDALVLEIGRALTSFKNTQGADPKDVTTNTISDIFESTINNLLAIKEIPYTKYNLECIEFVNKEDSESELLYEKFKLFSKKPRNIVRAVAKLNSVLQDKCKSLIDKAKSSAKKLGDYLWGVDDDDDENANPVDAEISNNLDESNIYGYLGTDYRFDKVLFREFVNENLSGVELHETFTSICKILNSELESMNNFTGKCYYVINGPIGEIHFKESTVLEIPEDINLDEYSNPDFEFYNRLLYEMYYFGEFINEDTVADIHKRFDEFASGKYGVCENKELINTIFEAISIIDNVQDEDSEPYQDADYPYWAQCEAYMCLDALLTPEVLLSEAGNKNVSHSSDDDDDDFDIIDKVEKTKSAVTGKGNNNDDNEDVKKNPFKGINLNNIKLTLQGIKSKFKGMSQKEKEVSKKVDNSFKLFVKNMKNALISDRREAIVKGSVVPSFSKCLKIGIALAGVAKFFDPGLAAITAIGGFAASKVLTNRERKMLLDEIEVELEVIDKEISNAESEGKMKKYRALLLQKKKLQREYQRIKYNVKVPFASSGTKPASESDY